METRKFTLRLPAETEAQLRRLAEIDGKALTLVLCDLVDAESRRRRLGLPRGVPARPGPRPKAANY
jgi:hypothetical protein